MGQAVSIYAVSTDALDAVWEDIKPFIQLGLDRARDELTIDDVYLKIRQHVIVPVVMSLGGKMLSVVTLEISGENKRIMSLMTAGGESMETWLDQFMKTAETLAREQQCEAIYLTGRRGWEKMLKNYGYSYAYTVLAKEL